MAGDIVKQLRDTRYPGQLGMRLEAADEIELLRQRLEFAEWEWNRATEALQKAMALSTADRVVPPADRVPTE